MAGIATAGPEPRIVVRELASGASVTAAALGTRAAWRLRSLWWVNDERILAYYDTYESGRGRILTVDRDGSRLKQKAFDRYFDPHSRQVPRLRLAARGQPLHLLPEDPRHVLIGSYGASTQRSAAIDVFELDVYRPTVRLQRLAERHRVLRWFPDSSGELQLGYGQVGLAGFVILRRPGQTKSTRVDSLAGLSIEPWRFEVLGLADDDHPLLASRHEGDRFTIYRLAAKDLKLSPPIFSHPRFDVNGPAVTDRRGRAVGIWYQDDFHRVHWLDPELAALAKLVDAQLPDRANRITDWDRDLEHVLVHSQSDRRGPRTLLLRVREKDLQTLAVAHPALDRVELAETRPIALRARDGPEIPGYLTLPVGTPPGEKHPVVVRLHGGPLLHESRASRDFDPEVQFLVSRGWAVLQPNQRGSTGFGWDFERRGHAEWAGAMIRDTIDAVRWLIRNGVADPARICVYGYAYGGYAALRSLAEAPELFRCGVALGAPSELGRLLDELRRYS